MIETTYENLDDILSKEEKICVIEFYKKSCGHCKLIEKELDALSKEYEDKIVFAKVDIEEQNLILQKFSIMSVPTIFLLKNGEMKEKLIGYYPKIVIEENIKKLISIH